MLLKPSWSAVQRGEAPGRRVLDQDRPSPPGASCACSPVVDRSVQQHPSPLDWASPRPAPRDRHPPAAAPSGPSSPARPGLPLVQGHLRPARRRVPDRHPDRLPLHICARPSTSSRPPLLHWPRPEEHPDESVRDAGRYAVPDRPDRRRHPYYSGKRKRHGMNVQVLTDPFGRLLRASPALPGSTTHGLNAVRTHGIIDALEDVGLNCWADSDVGDGVADRSDSWAD